jgi:hypothetical protein
MGESAWSQIMVGGSNVGEFLGAVAVFLLNQHVPTPIPWLRLDAIALLIVWYIPYWRPRTGDISQAWAVAGMFIPISFGWAAGDVSLSAYIQASVSRLERKRDDVSALAAVMAFLYSVYVVIYAILSPLLGAYLDSVYDSPSGNVRNDSGIAEGFVNIAGIQFTFVFILVFCSTFIPKGSSGFNPKMLFGDPLLVSSDEEDAGGDRVGIVA